MHNLFAATLLIAAVGSCDPAEFKNPLVDPAQARADGKLTGTWAARDESTEFIFFVQPVQSGLVDVTLVGRGPTDGVAHVSWRGLTSTVGGKTYLNLQEKVFTSNLENKYEVKPAYIVARYELKGDVLKLYYLTGGGLEATPEGPAAATADSAAVASTIQKLPPASFPHFLTFKRLKVP